ncbi:DNA glycosylase [Vararia minispora EC-137]|uniref:DNA glycosylase n=1 Tax=Vararia minispora EC-137 TaxID=1314806 RepID=A0ACB8QR56_9AGAM|nr:DNA glycosylase [Vararia minispora EC-137]
MAPGFRALPLPLGQLSLSAVLRCGQSFRWSIYPLSLSPDLLDPTRPSHEYRFCLRDRVVCLRQTSDALLFRSVFPVTPKNTEEKDAETLTWIRDYFQLDIDLLKLYEEWSDRDPVFARLRSRFEGIRMLRQDPWENLISFICSSNNNIARITKMIKSLCAHFSAPLLSLPPPLLPEPYYPFPSPSRLAEPTVSAILRSLGFGYRADYIQKTAAMLVDARSASLSWSGVEAPEEWLKALRKASTMDARNELLKLFGVGRKVADCVLLMSLDKKEVIPVDTHVHQIAIKHYGFRSSSSLRQTLSPKLYEDINSRLVDVWGDYAGWAHSVLFTADLKSFSAHGSPTPSPIPRRSRHPISAQHDEDYVPTTPPSSTSQKKRKCGVLALPATIIDTRDAASLAERVKRRRSRIVRDEIGDSGY